MNTMRRRGLKELGLRMRRVVVTELYLHWSSLNPPRPPPPLMLYDGWTRRRLDQEEAGLDWTRSEHIIPADLIRLGVDPPPARWASRTKTHGSRIQARSEGAPRPPLRTVVLGWLCTQAQASSGA